MLKRLFAVAIVAFAALSFSACAISTTTASGTNVTTASTTTATGSTTTTERVFSLTDLAQYNGNSGALAYIAVNGVVYDVTHADGWSSGWHRGMHLAGTDASAAFADSPHSSSLLASLPRVGTLAN